MNVSEQQLRKFKLLCKKRGIVLDDDQARDWAHRLLNVVAITRRPVPRHPQNNKTYDSQT